jgi:iron-sulfur cluster assembly protein
MSTVETTAPEASETGAAVLDITPAAAKQVRFLIQKKGDPSLGLRVGVKGGGCSGLSYVMNLEPAPRENDITFETQGLRVFVDPRSARFLGGTTLDYSIKNLLEGGWVWTNPNAGRTCGCGTSFTPK